MKNKVTLGLFRLSIAFGWSIVNAEWSVGGVTNRGNSFNVDCDSVDKFNVKSGCGW